MLPTSVARTRPIPRVNRRQASQPAASSTDAPILTPAVQLEEGGRLCTNFDILRQVEFVHTPACVNGPTLLEWAKERAKHLGMHVQGRKIQAEVEGLPTPQDVVHSAVHPRYTVTPWRLPFARHEICTVPVEIEPALRLTHDLLSTLPGFRSAWNQFRPARQTSTTTTMHNAVTSETTSSTTGVPPGHNGFRLVLQRPFCVTWRCNRAGTRTVTISRPCNCAHLFGTHL